MLKSYLMRCLMLVYSVWLIVSVVRRLWWLVFCVVWKLMVRVVWVVFVLNCLMVVILLCWCGWVNVGYLVLIWVVFCGCVVGWVSWKMGWRLFIICIMKFSGDYLVVGIVGVLWMLIVLVFSVCWCRLVEWVVWFICYYWWWFLWLFLVLLVCCLWLGLFWVWWGWFCCGGFCVGNLCGWWLLDFVG